MPVVACPKCKTKIKLSTEQLGKAVRCSSCQAKFRTPAPAPGGKPAAKAPSKKKSSAAPAERKPLTLEDELFSSAPLKPGAPDPLGNFVLEDPGFGSHELSDPVDDDDSDGDMFADRKHLMDNPALKERNPYASPVGGGNKGRSADARKMRQRLLRHEEAVKSLGFLLTLGGGLITLCLLVAVGFLMFRSPEDPEQASEMRYALLVMGIALVFWASAVAVGWSLFKLKNWAKIGATVLLIPNLLGFPVGTAISGYFLWVLHSAKGKEVFTDKYRKAIAATPDIRAGRRLMMIVGVLVLLVVLAAVVLAIFVVFSGGA